MGSDVTLVRTRDWRVYNGDGRKRVIVTKELPGYLWFEALTSSDCRVEVYTRTDVIDIEAIHEALGTRCHGAIGQLDGDVDL